MWNGLDVSMGTGVRYFCFDDLEEMGGSPMDTFDGANVYYET